MTNLLFSVRKLVALDIYAHGYTFVLLAFGIGTPLLFLFGLWLITAGQISGYYLTLVGFNYIPLLLYAIDIKRKNSAVKEGKSEMASATQYGIRQFLLLIPLLVFVLAIIQELDRIKKYLRK